MSHVLRKEKCTGQVLSVKVPRKSFAESSHGGGTVLAFPTATPIKFLKKKKKPPWVGGTGDKFNYVIHSSKG